MEQPKKPLIH